MLTDKIWVYNQILPDKVGRLAKEAGISELMARILINRGIAEKGLIKKFLNPSVSDLHDPFLIHDMDKAVDRIISAIKLKERIVVYGDYDVDGVTSTSILYDFLSGQGADVDFYIPGRIDEGYGLSIGAIDKIKTEGTKLIITVDCGITSIDEAIHAKKSFLDLIITDHHQCIDIIPDAYAVVNPCRPDCLYPFKSLAGVGVVYKLITSICIKMNLGELYNNYLDLVALGTVADVVPLIDENRVIVKFGIRMMEQTRNVGLKALIENAGISGKPLNSYSMSFLIAPRVNVAGRIGDACRAVKLFTTGDYKEAEAITEELNNENKYRQETEALILKEVIGIVESDASISQNKVLVIDGEGWHHGIIGIVASKISERYYKPCILISKDNVNGKGSARSVEGFNMFEALDNCRGLLEKYGGHELAAGLTLRSDNIGNFRTLINIYADKNLKNSDLVPKVKIDADITRNEMNIDIIREIDMLSPYGAGNPGPVFSCNGCMINEIRTVGEDKHLKLQLRNEGLNLDAIGFNMGTLASIFDQSDVLDVAFHLEINSWNSTERVQLNLKDIKPGEETIMTRKYYQSLCDYFTQMESSNSNDYNNGEYTVISSHEDFINQIEFLFNNSIKTAILVNSLESSKKLIKILRKSLPGIKKEYKICYTSYNDQDIDTICVIINPIPGALTLKFFDKVIIYGEWIDISYLNKFTNVIDKKNILIYKEKNEALYDVEMLVPERKDLVAVYQYLKTNFETNGQINDLFILSKQISRSYKLQFNYFKLIKCIEILSELGLLDVEQCGEYGMNFVWISKSKEKVNIESSTLYRKLQSLKKGG